MVYHSRQAAVLELPELEQRLSNLQTQVERLWRKAEANVPPVEQRLAAMADQYAEYLKRWAATVERHTQAVTQLEAYASEWKDASSRVRQETADRLHELETTIEREWDSLKRMQEQPIRELREQAETLTQVSVAMANASQQGVDRAEARFASFETEVHLRLTELTRELQTALAEMKARLDRQSAARSDSATQWSLDDVTRLHGQLREGTRPGEIPHTIDHPPASAQRELPAASVVDAHEARPRRSSSFGRRFSDPPTPIGIPGTWAIAVVVLGVAVLFAVIFGFRMQGQIREATDRARTAERKSDLAVSDAARQSQQARELAAEQIRQARDMAGRAQKIADVLAAPDLIRFNLYGGNGASGQALFSRSRGFVVNGSRLPSLPPNASHQVWLLTPVSPLKVGALVTESDGSGRLVQELPTIPRRVVGVMITAEASEAVDAPSGTTVLSSVASGFGAGEGQP
jgi:hypothetical protein